MQFDSGKFEKNRSLLTSHKGKEKNKQTSIPSSLYKSLTSATQDGYFFP